MATVSPAPTSTAPISPKQGRVLRIAKRVFLGLVILVLLVAVCGASYQAIATWLDSRRFPQEGRSVPLGAAFPGVPV